MTKLNPKKDKYLKNRGGYSHFYDILCKKCKEYVLTYQKDGPGELKRMYMDRIVKPEVFRNLQEKGLDQPDLACPACKRILAAPRIYPKEQRFSFYIFAHTIEEKETS